MRILATIIIGCIGLSAPFWVFGIAVCAYVVFVQKPYEMLCISVMLDALFGAGIPGMGYIYTILVSSALIIVAVLRPYIISPRPHVF